jgi:phosphatidylinositol dimannoside acyltransferase
VDVRDVWRTDGPFWRSLAEFGALHAPMPVLRYSPPAWGVAFAACLPEMRERVKRNLRRVRGRKPAVREELDVLKTIAHFASCLAEGMALARRELPRFRFESKGTEHVERAMRDGRGIVFVTAHTGMLEASGSILRKAFDLPLLFAMQGEADERSRRIHDDARRRAGVDVVHVGSDPLAVLPLLSHLKKKGAVGLQIDRIPRGMRTIGVVLFGERGEVPAGPFQLARATGSPIVPVFTRRRGFLDYEIRVYAPIVLDRGADDQALEAAARAAVTAMEDFIREDPTHWFHFVPE